MTPERKDLVFLAVYYSIGMFICASVAAGWAVFRWLRIDAIGR